MAQSYCGNCGNAVQPEDLLCVKCGSPLGSKNVVVEPTGSVMPVEEKNSYSPPPVSPDQQQAVSNEQQFPKPKVEGEKGTKGTPFKTGFMIGGISGFTFMFIIGIVTLPTALGMDHNSSLTCMVFLVAIGLAYGAGQWGKQFAKTKGLAPPSFIGEGVGSIIGGLIGAVIFSIIMAVVILAAFRNP
jgi:hypothetical protein